MLRLFNNKIILGVVTAALAQGCNDVGFKPSNPFSLSEDAIEPIPSPIPSVTPPVLPPVPPKPSPTPTVVPPKPSPTPTVVPPKPSPTPTVVPPKPSPTPTVVPPKPSPTPTVVPPKPSPTPTVVPPKPSPTPTVVPPKPSPTPTVVPPKPSPTPTVVPPTPSPSPTVVPPKPSPTPTPTVAACKVGLTISSISNVSSKGLTATFHGEDIQGITYEVLNSVGAVKASGSFKPIHNHPDLGFSKELDTGTYTLSFSATNCVGQSAKAFDIAPAVVCDPLGVGDGEGSDRNGLDAKLTFLAPDSQAVQSGIHNTTIFHPDAPQVTLSPSRLILSQLNVPTRAFTSGFRDEATGITLKNLDGETLIEWFSIQAQSNIVLDTSDAEGDYELAILSDDGSILDLDPTGEGKSYRNWIDNDGGRANTLGCAKSVLSMTRGKEIPIKMNYFQGPRESIALMMLWRQKQASTVGEPECGIPQNDAYYFQKTANKMSAPTAKYNALLTRGWKPLKIRNFVLQNGKLNPCLK